MGVFGGDEARQNSSRRSAGGLFYRLAPDDASAGRLAISGARKLRQEPGQASADRRAGFKACGF
jgi:hypothetical protein